VNKTKYVEEKVEYIPKKKEPLVPTKNRFKKYQEDQPKDKKEVVEEHEEIYVAKNPATYPEEVQ
jgi:hypothetical protein